MTDLSAHEVLCRAKALLMERGWVQEAFCSSDGRMCMHGAVNRVGAGWPAGHLANLALAAALGAGTDLYGSRGPMAFNDTPGRTFEEIIDAFDAAIWATAPKDTVSLDAELAGVA